MRRPLSCAEAPRPGRGVSVEFLVSKSKSSQYVSRGGEKLAAALEHFEIDVSDRVCADLGSHVGGFVDCLLQRGARRVYSVDTSYGTLAWTLRRDPRVEVLERTNAMHVVLPERIDLVTIDVAWTPQSKILPAAGGLLQADEVHDEPLACAADETTSHVLTLIKPHYEAPKDQLDAGVLPDELVDGVISDTVEQMKASGWQVVGTVESPIRGHAGNREFFALLSLAVC